MSSYVGILELPESCLYKAKFPLNRPASTPGRSLKPSICFALLAGLGSWRIPRSFRRSSWTCAIMCYPSYIAPELRETKIYSRIYGKSTTCSASICGQFPLSSHTLCCWSVVEDAEVWKHWLRCQPKSRHASHWRASDDTGRSQRWWLQLWALHQIRSSWNI